MPLLDDRWKPLRAIEDWSESLIEEVTDALKEFVAEIIKLEDWLKDLPIKLELCGSYAFGNAHSQSDIDFNLALPDWNLQKRMWDFYETYKEEWDEARKQLMLRLKCPVNVACLCPDNREYNEIYDLGERRLYNRQWGNPLPNTHHRFWDRRLLRWQLINIHEGDIEYFPIQTISDFKRIVNQFSYVELVVNWLILYQRERFYIVPENEGKTMHVIQVERLCTDLDRGDHPQLGCLEFDIPYGIGRFRMNFAEGRFWLNDVELIDDREI